MHTIRRMVPDMPILIPGIGAQGGDLKAAVRYGCDRHGELGIINASRGVIFASSGDDFAEAARAAAVKLRDEINQYRDAYF
jgi:orotidine-5'-phosphate decarboxylase